MKRTSFSSALLPVLLLGLGSCAATDEGVESKALGAGSSLGSQELAEDVDEQSDESAEEETVDLQKLERALHAATVKHEVSAMELASFEQKQVNSLQHSQAEVEMAKAKLKNFLEVEGPNSLAQQKLNMQGAEERAAEAAEELAQIMIMYEEQDLDDMTREYVVARGKRRADRAQASIAIQASTLQSFESHELPTKRRRMELEVSKAVQGLEQAKLDGEISRINKHLSLQQAENKLQDAQQELNEAQAEDS